MKPRVSEHALMRYLERVKEVDMDAVRKQILTPKLVEAIKTGAEVIKIDNAEYVIRNGTIVTINTQRDGIGSRTLIKKAARNRKKS